MLLVVGCELSSWETRLTVYDPTGTRDRHTNQLEALREYLRVEADRERNG